MNLVVEAKTNGRNPYTVVCYICGRDFGSKSISIHEPKCLENFQKTQGSLPKSQRRPIPIRPNVSSLPLLPSKEGDPCHHIGSTGQKVSAENNLGASLGHDTRNTSGSAGEQQSSLDRYNEAAYATYSEQSRTQCPNCPHKFAPGRLEVHLRSCKPGGLFSTKASKQDNQKKMAAGSQNQTQLSPQSSQPTSTALKKKPTDAMCNVESKAPKGQKSLKPAKASVVSQSTAPPTTHNGKSFCTQCGDELNSGDRFCASCGAKRK
ncbi:hypothetical protein BASA60_006335 [Batrachochytrium salamandrivorans]|nr:hypothetical protein BASA60_006335 [Batrachochytrium salamandrivorans]KAH9246720.1 hypothetical protein BASA81_015724 [Batrachochytrium salamandrivorans]KAH9267858.1 hypothetical protein BASA83_009683 [Batrachochytrium salamandrivorans]